MPVRTEMAMGTLVTIHVVADGAAPAIERAFGWFRAIEACCTRFDDASELMQLCAHPSTPVRVSDILFSALRFAVAVARETAGAFDPTVSRTSGASYEDLLLDEKHQTITLRRPLALDLGAVAKGLAVDAAARELHEYRDFVVEAGGDLFLSGRSPRSTPWAVGIPHPRLPGELIERITASDCAVCTSGDYERGGHVLDPRTGSPPHGCASVTVVAPNALLADALATAAFVLGPAEGLRLLDRHGVEGVIFTPRLERHATEGFPRG